MPHGEGRPAQRGSMKHGCRREPRGSTKSARSARVAHPFFSRIDSGGGGGEAHGRDPWHRRDALSTGTRSRRTQAVAAGADAAQRPAHSRTHERSRELAGADARANGATTKASRRTRRTRRASSSAFRKIREEIDAFEPDFIVMWGDDQYENFKEDIIPPFCVLAYDEFDFKPYARLRGEAQHLGRAGRQGLHPSRTPQGRALSRASGCSRKASTCRMPTSRCTRTAWATPSRTRCSTSISTAKASRRRSCRSR